MDRKEIIKNLIELQNNPDYEDAHYKADDLLLKFIDDPEIEEEFLKIGRYYN